MMDNALARFLIGIVAIVAVLKIVSGDQHIHVAAPAILLAVWFIITAILLCVEWDNTKRKVS